MVDQVIILVMFYFLALASIGWGFLLTADAPAAPYVISAIWLIVLSLLTKYTIQWGKDEKRLLEIPSRVEYGRPRFQKKGNDKYLYFSMFFAPEDIELVKKSWLIQVTYHRYDYADGYTWSPEAASAELNIEEDKQSGDDKEFNLTWHGNSLRLCFLIEEENRYQVSYRHDSRDNFCNRVSGLYLSSGNHYIALPIPDFSQEPRPILSE